MSPFTKKQPNPTVDPLFGHPENSSKLNAGRPEASFELSPEQARGIVDEVDSEEDETPEAPSGFDDRSQSEELMDTISNFINALSGVNSIFTKHLDGALKNLQQSPELILDFYIKLHTSYNQSIEQMRKLLLNEEFTLSEEERAAISILRKLPIFKQRELISVIKAKVTNG